MPDPAAAPGVRSGCVHRDIVDGCTLHAEVDWEHGDELVPLDEGEEWIRRLASSRCLTAEGLGTLISVDERYSAPPGQVFQRYVWACW